ncbi:MAG TPA: carboxypeptidase regulatory-like domain-containing protein [Bryobacteraceae bacterium]|nr:carboxypeptidase regulatory-like domain-containing protein [Bryobacteraceae bacterium]HPU73899.1 carboxypeptidase regulatory-like domain-containing protein [Bryobacteraceae bacterium]
MTSVFTERGRVYRAALLTIVFTLVAAVALHAQERFGELSGVVTDSSSAVVPDVVVTVKNKGTGRVFTTRTGAAGSYIAPGLEPGHYSVVFEATGFQKYEVADVNLLVGQRLKVDGTLTVGSVTETVQVTEAAPLIDTSRTSIAHNVTSEEFDRLPKARSFQALALASPSVNTGEIEGGFQVNGASGAENQFNIDGVSTTSLINGKSRQNAVFEILQEVQVKTGGIDAEYGGALGGVISAVTKSGGNAFHGDLHYYYSGNGLSAAPVKRLVADPVTERTAMHIQDRKQTDNTHEIGGTLGGYFVKDMLYFFTAFSPQFRRQAGDYNLSNGAESAHFSRDSTFHQMFNKISWDPVSRIRTNFSWLWSPTKVSGYLPRPNSTAPDTTTLSLAAVTPIRDSGYFQPQSSYTGQVDISVTTTSLLTVRAGRFWDNYKSVGLPNLISITYQNSAVDYEAIPEHLRQPRGFANIARQVQNDYDIVTRTFIQTDFSKFGNLLGQHNLKVGWGFSKTVNRMDNHEMGGGYINVFWNSPFLSPTLGENRGVYGYYEFNDRRTAGVTGAGMHNMFIQDQWRITRRLSLTLGLRVENEKVPTFRRDIKDYGFEFGFADKIAPRLGASFDLFGDGRAKIYGSWGRYFDWVKYELSRGTFGGDIWRVHYRSLDSPDVFNLLSSASLTNLPGTNLWSSEPGSFRDRRVPSFDLVAKNIKPMSQDNMNFGVEYQIAPQTVFRGNYVHTNLRRTIEDLGALNEQGDEVYLYGNPGEGQAKIMPTSGKTPPFPMPKPVRKYDALELTVTRRFSRGMFGSFSYVYSRLWGNYAGLANSDEITSPATGNSSATAQQLGGSIARPGGNANRSWDLDEVLFDSHGNVDIKGRLATDRPHVFKLYGNKEFNWRSGQTTDIGIFQYAGSGTPLTTTVNTVNQIPVMVEGRGDMGRTAFLTQTDLMIGHTVSIGENKRLRFEFNALNVFNQKTSRRRFSSLNRGSGAGGGRQASAIDLSNINLFEGFDYRALLAQTADQLTGPGAYDPLYGLTDIFNPGFAGRFGVKFTF